MIHLRTSSSNSTLPMLPCRKSVSILQYGSPPDPSAEASCVRISNADVIVILNAGSGRRGWEKDRSSSPGTAATWWFSEYVWVSTLQDSNVNHTLCIRVMTSDLPYAADAEDSLTYDELEVWITSRSYHRCSADSFVSGAQITIREGTRASPCNNTDQIQLRLGSHQESREGSTDRRCSTTPR